MTDYRSFRHLPDGTPAPLSCWNSTSPETETFEPEIETRDEVACLELAAVLNVDRNRVSIQNRALMAGAIYPFFYEVSLARDTRSHGSPSLRMAITPDLQGAFLTFLSPELERVEDVVDLLHSHWVPSPNAASIRSAIDQAASRNGPVPWLRIPAAEPVHCEPEPGAAGPAISDLEAISAVLEPVQ